MLRGQSCRRTGAARVRASAACSPRPPCATTATTAARTGKAEAGPRASEPGAASARPVDARRQRLPAPQPGPQAGPTTAAAPRALGPPAGGLGAASTRAEAAARCSWGSRPRRPTIAALATLTGDAAGRGASGTGAAGILGAAALQRGLLFPTTAMRSTTDGRPRGPPRRRSGAVPTTAVAAVAPRLRETWPVL